MSTAEHLIENALVQYEKEQDVEAFRKNKLIQEQAVKVGISMDDLLQIVLYIYYDYRQNLIYETKDRIIKDYGYDIYKDEEENI